MNEILCYFKHKKNLSKNWECQENNFEHTGNSAHTAEFFALGKALNIYIEDLMFLPKRTRCRMKALQLQVYIQQWFDDEQGVKFM